VVVLVLIQKVEHDHQANLQNLVGVKANHHKNNHDHQVKKNLLVVEKVIHQINQLLVHQVNHEITRKIKMLKLNNHDNVDDRKVVKNNMKVNKNKDPNLQKRNQQEVRREFLIKIYF
jgi:hypothetical protein